MAWGFLSVVKCVTDNCGEDQFWLIRFGFIVVVPARQADFRQMVTLRADLRHGAHRMAAPSSARGPTNQYHPHSPHGKAVD